MAGRKAYLTLLLVLHHNASVGPALAFGPDIGPWGLLGTEGGGGCSWTKYSMRGNSACMPHRNQIIAWPHAFAAQNKPEVAAAAAQ